MFVIMTGSDDELLWWLDDRAHPYKHIVYPGEYTWRDEDKETYVDRVDGGLPWQVRKSSKGRLTTKAARTSRGGAIYQTAYSRMQYELVGWAMWALDNGWTKREVWQILRRFWKLLPGQTPFVSRTVNAWRSTQARMRKKGLRWP